MLDLKFVILLLIVDQAFPGSIYFLEPQHTEYKIIKGEPLTLNCSVNMPSSVEKVTWTRDNVRIEKYKRSPREVYMEAKLILKVFEATAEDSARYSCKVRIKGDSRTDIEKIFNVLPIAAPNIVTLPKKVIIAKVDDPVRFKCAVSKYFTTSYKWFLNGKEIVKDQLKDTRYKIKDYQFLKIRRVLGKDIGSYTCSVSNNVATQEVTYFLDVLGRGNKTADLVPKLITNTTFYLEIALNDINLDCRVTGARPVNMTWIKDGKLLKMRKGITPYKYFHDRQVLQLTNVVPNDRGFYTCIAKNRFGKMIHKMQVDVLERKRASPLFLDEDIPSKYFGRIGENITVRTLFLAFGNVHFQLLLETKRVNKTTNISASEFQVLKTPRSYKLVRKADAAAEYQLKFYFRNLTNKDFQNYTVMAGNVVGYDVFRFSIEEEKARQFRPTTAAVVIKVDAVKKPFVNTTPFIVLVLFACFLVVATFVTFLYCFRSKRGFKNNNKHFYSKARLEKVVLNIDRNIANKHSLNGNHSRDNIRRISSCHTEKEYLTARNIPADPEWDVHYGNIEFHKLLGEGAFGLVMLGVVHGLPRHPEPMTVAIKMLKNNATEQELKDLLSEMEVMKNIGKHVNIINLLGVSTQQDDLCMIVEYCRYGNLREYLKERRPAFPPCPPPVEQLTMQNLISYCYQVAKGMDYLSSRKCVHRDIAARNVLVADDHVMKIADFGLARDIHGDEYYRKQTDGRLPVKWMALEALFDRVYTIQSDVWSYGILMWEIVTFGGSPYPGVPFEKLCEILSEGYRMEKPVNCTDQLYQLMSNCWKPEPSNRPKFSAIVDELEQQLLTISGLEYLEIQPLVESRCPTESVSSEQPSPTDSRRHSNGVFEGSSDDGRESLLSKNTNGDLGVA